MGVQYSFNNIDKKMTTQRILENIEKAQKEWMPKQPIREPDAMNKHGYRGVTYVKSDNRYVARIKVKGKRLHLGSFKTPGEASKAYQSALDIIIKNKI